MYLGRKSKYRDFRYSVLFGVTLLIILISNFSQQTLKNKSVFDINQSTYIDSSDGSITLASVSPLYIKPSVFGSNFTDYSFIYGTGTINDPFIIANLSIIGTENNFGIEIEDSNEYYFKIVNCTIKKCLSGIKVYNSAHYSIENSTILEYEHAGILIYEAFDVNISDNAFSGGRIGVDLTDNVQNTTICNNTILDFTLTGIYVDGGNNVEINGNKIISKGENGISTPRGKNILIDDNFVSGTKEDGIRLELCEEITLKNNILNATQIKIAQFMGTIDLDESNKVNDKSIKYLENTQFETINSSNPNYDIGQLIITNSSYLIIQDRSFTRAGEIQLIDTENMTIYDLTINKSIGHGFSVENCRNITINNSVMIDSHGYGISSIDSHDSTHINNNITGSWLGGIYGFDSNGNIIKSNYIEFDSPNTCILFYGENNVIEENTCIDITKSINGVHPVLVVLIMVGLSTFIVLYRRKKL